MDLSRNNTKIKNNENKLNRISFSHIPLRQKTKQEAIGLVLHSFIPV